MKNILIILAAIFGIGVLVFISGPRPNDEDTVSFSAQSLPQDLDDYLKSEEANIPNIVTGAEKEIVWSSLGPGKISDIALVYIHGFSATKHEIRPIPDQLAKALDANLYYTRLTGHGRDGDGLAQTSMKDWANDYAQAMAIAQRIGKKTIIIATSTGAALTSWSLQKPEMTKNVIGMIFISPNYSIQRLSVGLLNMPWGETILPALMGQTINLKAHNELQKKWRTNSYPSRAVFPMAALLKLANNTKYEKVKIPVLMIYSMIDKVVVPQTTQTISERWGADVERIIIEKSDDPNNHLIVGDMGSPSNNNLVKHGAIKWLQKLVKSSEPAE